MVLELILNSLRLTTLATALPKDLLVATWMHQYQSIMFILTCRSRRLYLGIEPEFDNDISSLDYP